MTGASDIAIARPARLLGRTVTICALAGAFLLATAATASADTALRFWHFNMCGAVIEAPCNGGHDQPVSDAIKSSIESYRPHAVSLNEACQSQWGTTYWNLNAAGVWTMGSRFVTTRYLGAPTATSRINCNLYDGNRRFGNALFSRQAILLEPSATPLPKTQTTSETRRLWCMVVDLYRDTVYCTVHITNYDDDIEEQIRTVATTVDQWVDDGIPVVLMGDFNVTPNDDRLDPIYHSSLGGGATGRFEEVDEYYNSSTRGRRGEATHPKGKIDYIFVSARDFYSVDGDATSSSYSDHVPLRGSATLDHTP
ncbi:MAG TPA: endonuclease/exonuclease/phosphatase family protein [Thermoleophilaceae bacterium]